LKNISGQATSAAKKMPPAIKTHPSVRATSELDKVFVAPDAVQPVVPGDPPAKGQFVAHKAEKSQPDVPKDAKKGPEVGLFEILSPEVASIWKRFESTLCVYACVLHEVYLSWI
jgi:hypothetical protein